MNQIPMVKCHSTTLDLLDRVQNQAIRLINNPEITDKLDSLKHRRDASHPINWYGSSKLFTGQLYVVIPKHDNFIIKKTIKSVEYNSLKLRKHKKNA